MTMNYVSPTAPKPSTPLYRYLKGEVARLITRLEEVGKDYDRVLVEYGRDSHQEGARFYQYEGLLDEYMRCEDVLRGERTPSNEDYQRARELENQEQSARNVQTKKRRR